MFPRLVSAPLLLGAAVGIPYVATNGPNLDGVFNKTAPASVSAQTTSDEQLLEQLTHSPAAQSMLPRGPGSELYPVETPLEGLPALSLHEVFNLNVTKEWVYQRWSRKSTGLAELGLFGVRVPLVTGTQLHDLAGSLTYFFNQAGRVQRISFHGTTGDTTQLVMLAAQQFGLQRQATPVAGEQLLQIRRQNQVFSELRTRPASVLWSSSPHDSFAVDFELQHPQATTPLPAPWTPQSTDVPPSPAPQASVSQPTGESSPSPTADDQEDQAASPEEKWKAFFPRSRVPKEQVDSLDRHHRLW